MRETLRREHMIDALRVAGLELRDDSKLCQLYIEGKQIIYYRLLGGLVKCGFFINIAIWKNVGMRHIKTCGRNGIYSGITLLRYRILQNALL